MARRIGWSLVPGRPEALHRPASMQAAQWTARDEMPDTRRTFSDCGNWRKADIVEPQRSALVERVLLPFVAEFVDSFEGVVGRVMNFNYFNYASGDCLSLHTDERSERLDDTRRESIPTTANSRARYPPVGAGTQESGRPTSRADCGASGAVAGKLPS